MTCCTAHTSGRRESDSPQGWRIEADGHALVEGSYRGPYSLSGAPLFLVAALLLKRGRPALACRSPVGLWRGYGMNAAYAYEQALPGTTEAAI